MWPPMSSSNVPLQATATLDVPEKLMQKDIRQDNQSPFDWTECTVILALRVFAIY